MNEKFKYKSNEAKKLLKVSDCKLMHLREQDVLRAVKKGRSFYYHEEDIRDYNNIGDREMNKSS